MFLIPEGDVNYTMGRVVRLESYGEILGVS